MRMYEVVLLRELSSTLETNNQQKYIVQIKTFQKFVSEIVSMVQ